MIGVTQACDEGGLSLTVVFARTYCCCVFGKSLSKGCATGKGGFA